MCAYSGGKKYSACLHAQQHSEIKHLKIIFPVRHYHLNSSLSLSIALQDMWSVPILRLLRRVNTLIAANIPTSVFTDFYGIFDACHDLLLLRTWSKTHASTFPHVLVFCCWVCEASVFIKLQCRVSYKRTTMQYNAKVKERVYTWWDGSFYWIETNTPGQIHYDITCHEAPITVACTSSIFWLPCDLE